MSPDLPRDVSLNPHFRTVKGRWTPWTPVSTPLPESRVALVTMGGFYLSESQPPFTDEDNRGDTSFRPIPRDVEQHKLRIAHTHYDHRYVEADLNVLFPIALFRERERRGIIGELADTHYSFMGSVPDPLDLLANSSLEVAWRLREARVDRVILSSA